MRDFIPTDHYWRVSGDAESVWSSGVPGYVPKDDPTYRAWCDAGDATTPIASEAELADVLRGFGLAVPPAQVDLRALASAARYARETGGITVGGVRVATDRDSQSMVTAAYVKASRDGAFKTPWKGSDGTFTVLDAATILALGDAVTAHVAACFAIEAGVDADIGAGKVTTPAEVDAAFAALSA